MYQENATTAGHTRMSDFIRKPVIARMKFYLNSELKCDEPKDPVNGYVEKSGISLEFQSVIRYRCNQGYRIVGSAQGECNGDGNWGIMPKCAGKPSSYIFAAFQI